MPVLCEGTGRGMTRQDCTNQRKENSFDSRLMIDIRDVTTATLCILHSPVLFILTYSAVSKGS